jgi:hypothetical protein
MSESNERGRITKAPGPEPMLFWGGRPLIEHMHLFSSTHPEAACGVGVRDASSVSMGAPPPLEQRCNICETAWQREQTPIAGLVRKALNAPFWTTSREVKIVASLLSVELARVQREVNEITNRLRAISTGLG